MGFGSLLKGIATGGMSFLPKSKNPLVAALTGYYNPFGGGQQRGMPPINPADMNAANSYLGTFSQGDQANIRAGLNSPYQMIDWYRNAQAAAPPPAPSGMGAFGAAAAPMFSQVGGQMAGGFQKPAPVEQPTDYAALEEQRKANQARRANWAVNKPPMA